MSDIQTDPGLLERILANLIDNALKFVKQDNPQVKISAVEHEDEWEISVSDNGIGIKEEYQDKIFQIFQALNTKGFSA